MADELRKVFDRIRRGRWLENPQWRNLGYLAVVALVGILMLFLGQHFGSSEDRADGVDGFGPGAAVPKTMEAVPAADGSVQAAERARAVLALERELADRLEAMLSQIEGVGPVAVSLHLDGGFRHRYEQNVSTVSTVSQREDAQGGRGSERSEREERTLVLQRVEGRDEPVLSRATTPEILGVLIAAEGAGDPRVKSRLLAATAALYDLPVHRISVVERAGDAESR